MSVKRRILVFAKAPIAGQVKTRLHTRLSPIACADLHRVLSLHTLKTACESRLASVELWCTPTISHPFVQECVKRFLVEPHLQLGSDLGERMHHALNHSLRNNEQVLIVGTDCPLIDKPYLSSAFEVLQQGDDVVLGPAEDGGYVLIGMKRFDRALFEGVSWGTERVLKQTRAALFRLGRSWSELEPLWDIDRPDDLSRLCADPRLSEVFATRTEFNT